MQINKHMIKQALIILFVLFIYNYIFSDSTQKAIEVLQNRVIENTDAINALVTDNSITKNKIEQEKKVRINNEILMGFECIKCHNSPETALPLSDKNVEEAIQAVRMGTEKSIEGGMPIYYQNKAEANDNNSTHIIPNTTLRDIITQLYGASNR